MQLRPAEEGCTTGTLATAGGVGNLPVSQAYHKHWSEGEGAVASDRRRITGARRSGRRESVCTPEPRSPSVCGSALTGLAAVPWQDLDLNFSRPDMWTTNPPMETCSPGDLGAPDAASIVDRPSAPRSANFCGGPLAGCCNAACTVLDSNHHVVTRPARALTVQLRLLFADDRPTASRAHWLRFAQGESFIGALRRHFWVRTSMHLERVDNLQTQMSMFRGDNSYTRTRREKCDSGVGSPATPENGCSAFVRFRRSRPDSRGGRVVHTHTVQQSTTSIAVGKRRMQLAGVV